MKTIIITIVTALVLVAGTAAFLYWRSIPEPQPVQAPTAPVVPADDISMQQEMIEPTPETPAPPEPPALPALSESDSYMWDALAGLINNESWMKLFLPAHLIQKMVATIDNLPRKHLPRNIVFVKRLRGPFMVEGPEGNYNISPNNAARYAVYVKIAESIDARKLVDAYVHLYPLFQEAYKELGYPDKYFNDRLLAVIDNLLAAPDVKDPVWLRQPNVMYLYADPDLEASSAGQKILMRMGSANAAVVKSKLRDIKQIIMLRMTEKQIGATP
jgi:hypothetical protein